MPRTKAEGGGGGQAMGKTPPSSSMECQKRKTYLNKQKQQQRNAQALSNISQ